MEIPQFEGFRKIPRLVRPFVVTEKIDGTNGQIYITDDMTQMYVGSRTRWLTISRDNYGFYRWTADHREELMQLGPGRHYGEWWGSGIQRGYGLSKGEKRFSLFNLTRWKSVDDPMAEDTAIVPPACCSVVPRLGGGSNFTTTHVDACLEWLHEHGSKAAPGFMQPEGVVVYHPASGTCFKQTLEKDASPKGVVPVPVA